MLFCWFWLQGITPDGCPIQLLPLEGFLVSGELRLPDQLINLFSNGFPLFLLKKMLCRQLMDSR